MIDPCLMTETEIADTRAAIHQSYTPTPEVHA